jgi:hypothetical protein
MPVPLCVRACLCLCERVCVCVCTVEQSVCLLFLVHQVLSSLSYQNLRVPAVLLHLTHAHTHTHTHTDTHTHTHHHTQTHTPTGRGSGVRALRVKG